MVNDSFFKNVYKRQTVYLGALLSSLALMHCGGDKNGSREHAKADLKSTDSLPVTTESLVRKTDSSMALLVDTLTDRKRDSLDKAALDSIRAQIYYAQRAKNATNLPYQAHQDPARTTRLNMRWAELKEKRAEQTKRINEFKKKRQKQKLEEKSRY